MPTSLIAGNWKMNGLRDSAGALADALAGLARSRPVAGCELLVCPPAHLLLLVGARLDGSGIELGAQDCHAAESGAHTGDISAAMLRDAGCGSVIVGHSERRSDHGESDAEVRAKAAAALAAGLRPIVCVGETEEQRAAGDALKVIEGQLRGSLPEAANGGTLAVAYEPVWAIGTGRTATPDDVAEVHRHIRALLRDRLGAGPGSAIQVLYGGSVKPGNAAELLAVPDVNGALVGGASLEAEDFWAIAEAAA